MSKAFFRFLRGELNGFYITSINQALIEYSSDIRRFLLKFHEQQFNLDTMSSETLYNLGKFASVFLPRRRVSEVRSSVYMTESHEVDGEEYSERGLLNTETELFEFEHTSQGEYSDINTLATDTKRSSLVGDEAVIGYIEEGELDVLDDNGNVRPEKVLAYPPENKAYTDYFGSQFSFLAEGDTTWENVSASLFIELFKAIQWIRYNGKSIKALTHITELLCPQGLVKIGAIESSATNIIVHYVYDPEVPITSKESRLSLLQYIVSLKFKQVILTEE